MAGLKCIVDLFYCLVSPSCEQNRQEFRSSSIKTVLKVLPLKFKGKYRRGGFLHDMMGNDGVLVLIGQLEVKSKSFGVPIR